VILFLDGGGDGGEWLRLHFVLERGELSQRLGRQQVSARAEELAQLDEQAAHLDCRLPEIAQHTLERLDIRARLVVATLARAHDTHALAIHDEQCAQEQ